MSQTMTLETREYLTNPDMEVPFQEIESVIRADLRENVRSYVDDLDHHAQSLLMFQTRRDSILTERARRKTALENAAARVALNSVDEDEQLRIQTAWADLELVSSQSSRMQTARWAHPTDKDGNFEVDTSPRDETLTPLLGTAAFGAYSIWVGPEETYHTRGGDEILLGLAGDGTIQYDFGFDYFKAGECALVEAGRPARFRAGRTAMVMLGVGDSRLWTGPKEMASYVEKATWATSPENGVLQVDTSPCPLPMAKSEGTARELVAIYHRMGVNMLTFAAGKKVLPHTHAAEHILPVTGGTGRVMFRGEDYIPKPGTLYGIPSWVLHAVYGGEIEDLSLLAFSNRYEAPNSDARLDMAA